MKWKERLGEKQKAIILVVTMVEHTHTQKHTHTNTHTQDSVCFGSACPRPRQQRYKASQFFTYRMLQRQQSWVVRESKNEIDFGSQTHKSIFLCDKAFLIACFGIFVFTHTYIFFTFVFFVSSFNTVIRTTFVHHNAYSLWNLWQAVVVMVYIDGDNRCVSPSFLGWWCIVPM